MLEMQKNIFILYVALIKLGSDSVREEYCRTVQQYASADLSIFLKMSIFFRNCRTFRPYIVDLSISKLSNFSFRPISNRERNLGSQFQKRFVQIFFHFFYQIKPFSEDFRKLIWNFLSQSLKNEKIQLSLTSLSVVT